MIFYTIEPSRLEYLAQEEVSLALVIENRGAESVDIPDPLAGNNNDPVYEIVRSPAEGEAQGTRALISNWSSRQGPALPPPTARIPLAPGAKWQGNVSLSRLAPIMEQAGEYQIGSSITVETAQVIAPKRTLRIQPPVPATVNLSQGLRPFNHGQGELVFLQKEKSANGVYIARVEENEPANSEVSVRAMMRRANASANANDAMSASSNVGLYADLLQWIVWREGATVKSLSTAETAPLSVTLASEPDHLVKPALTTKGGPVSVLARKGASLTLVSIPSKIFAQPEQKWTFELPVVPVSITAAIAPVQAGGTRYVVFAGATGNAFDIYCATFTEAGLGSIDKLTVPGGKLLGRTPITAAVDAEGVLHVLAIRESAGEERQLALIEATFGKGEPKFTAGDLPKLAKPVDEGGLLLVVADGKVVRRDVVISSEKAMWNLTSKGTFAQIVQKPRFYSPVILLAGKELSYILFQNDKGAFHFQPLNR